jgi:hypothetical protein
LSLSSE